ncbi:MAG: hypothetical protein F2737_11985 [Actinobacteria bacterium]|nr:hypothetical protein [Actinomycetota bacterium]
MVGIITRIYLADRRRSLIRAGDMTVEQFDGRLRLAVADWPGVVVSA